MSFLTNLFGDTKVPTPAPVTPPGFSGGGLNVSFDGGKYNTTVDPNRTAAVGDIQNTYSSLGNELGTLRAGVGSGYNDLLNSRLTDLDNQGRSAIGNLRQNLQARRIQGSSFGEDTLTRARLGVQQQRDAVIADNYQKSLEANTNLLNQQYNAYLKNYQSGLDELNFEANAASGLVGNASNILAKNAELQSKANEFNATMSNNQATGFGKLVGGVGSLALAPFTGGLSLAALPMFGGANVFGKTA